MELRVEGICVNHSLFVAPITYSRGGGGVIGS